MSTARPRLLSLDQFRGYTVIGMLLVNFLGSFSVCPRILKHTNDYCSYADTFMPHFLFAAGFSMRLSWERLAQLSRSARWLRFGRRLASLSLLAIVWYSLGEWGGIRKQLAMGGWTGLVVMLAKRTWFQTLLHIAVTSAWIYPVIGKDLRTRVAWAVASGLLHVVLSWAFNFEWVNHDPRGIDGGPLGFLTWSIPALAGTAACDWCCPAPERSMLRMLITGLMLGGLGYLIATATTLYDFSPKSSSNPQSQLASDPVWPASHRWNQWKLPEPPFVPPPAYESRPWNYWMMSQRAATLSYCTFAAGVSLLVYTLFVWACDCHGRQISIFRTFGTNALAAYILHEILGWCSDLMVRRQASVVATLTAMCVYLLATYLLCRLLEWKQWYLRL